MLESSTLSVAPLCPIPQTPPLFSLCSAPSHPAPFGQVTDTPDPYIEFLPEPSDLEISHLEPKAAAKGSVFGKSGVPVRTHTLDNTYAPAWHDKAPEFTVAVKVAGLEDLNGCHLHLACMDHDTLTKDDPIGSASLSLGRLYAHHQEHGRDPLPLPSAMLMDGVRTGTFAGSVQLVYAGSVAPSGE